MEVCGAGKLGLDVTGRSSASRTLDVEWWCAVRHEHGYASARCSDACIRALAGFVVAGSRSTRDSPVNRKSLFITKPFSAEGSPSGEASLKRVLTARHLVQLGIGGMIGAGIFVLTGQAAANHAGPAITLSFVLAGIAVKLAARYYANIPAPSSHTGSSISYLYPSIGELKMRFISANRVHTNLPR